MNTNKVGESPTHSRHNLDSDTNHNHYNNFTDGRRYSKLHGRRSSIDETNELKRQRKREIDSRINMVFNEEGDEEFRKALTEDDHPSNTAVGQETHLPAIRSSEIAADKQNIDSDRQFKLHLDGFEIGATDTQSKRNEEESALEPDIELKVLEAKRKKKAGIYDLEPVEKLKEKGYNLFVDITEAYGEASHLRARQNTNTFSNGS